MHKIVSMLYVFSYAMEESNKVIVSDRITVHRSIHHQRQNDEVVTLDK